GMVPLMALSLHGARRVKDDLVIVPKALEETQRSTLVLTRPHRILHNVGQRPLPVNGAKQPVLKRVDGENEIGKGVRPVDQHRDAAGRQTSRTRTVHGSAMGM